MSLKTRLVKLEEAQKAKSVYQETPESREKSRQKTIEWLNNTTRDINERARLVAEGLVIQGPPEPIKPLKANPTHTDIWIHRMLIEAREIERRELDASYELKNPTG
jgi:hypothetical protein